MTEPTDGPTSRLGLDWANWRPGMHTADAPPPVQQSGAPRDPSAPEAAPGVDTDILPGSDETATVSLFKSPDIVPTPVTAPQPPARDAQTEVIVGPSLTKVTRPDPVELTKTTRPDAIENTCETPANTAHNTALEPGNTIPGNTIPGNIIPDGAIPGGTFPNSAAYAQTQHAVPLADSGALPAIGGAPETAGPAYAQTAQYPLGQSSAPYPTTGYSATDYGAPQQYSQSPPNGYGYPPERNSAMPYVVVAVSLAVIVIALVAGLLIWNAKKEPGESLVDAFSGGGSPDEVSACSSAPSTDISAISTTLSGLQVTLSATGTCDSGDVLANSDTRITVSGPGGVVAAGSFDFSSNPVGLPSNSSGRQLMLTFPPGSYFGTPAADSANSYSLSVTREGVEGAATVPASSEPYSATVSSPWTPDGTSAEALVNANLRTRADTDRKSILASYDGAWVAQLSSKRPGLYAEGRTWDNASILEEFVSLDQRFDGAWLLWSDEWPVFSTPSLWVTVTRQTFTGPAASLDWCRQQGFDRDHCVAKMISSTRSPEGTTAYLR